MDKTNGRKRRKLSNGADDAKALVEGTISADEQPNSGPAQEALSQSSTAPQRSSIFVRSLPSSVTSESLAAHFSQSHPIKHATVVVDPKTKISRGFGFVTYTDVEDARAAVEELNNSELDGRKIKLEIAQPRHRELVAGSGADIENGEAKRSTTRGRVNQTAIDLKAAWSQKDGDTQPPRLIVRNLPWSVKTPEDLTRLFQSYGKIKHVVLPKGKKGEMSGFGFVTIRGRKNAEKALKDVNGKLVDGRELAVDWAVERSVWEEAKGNDVAADEAGAATNGEESGVISDIDKLDGGEVVDDLDRTQDHEDIPMIDQELEALSDEDVMNLSDQGSPAEENSPSFNAENTTIFIRNLPYTADDDILRTHFKQFGPIRYARVVYDAETERSKGTGFVCFATEEHARECVRNCPKPQSATDPAPKRAATQSNSILQNELLDPSGRYTLDTRVLLVSRALSKEAAPAPFTSPLSAITKSSTDKRRMYLLSEGTITPSSPLFDQLPKPEQDLRSASAAQRRKLIKTNPNLAVSLTRLSIRNAPRTLTSKDLKALAREAVVGFATDVKNGTREPLSAEEKSRGADEARKSEHARKVKGVGVVRQAKIVFEGREGEKVKEGGGKKDGDDEVGGGGAGGRSRGYGFVEYSSHRWALMGLRWLNGHLVKPAKGGQSGKNGERGKRLIVEFAIEDVRVVRRRSDREKGPRNVSTGGSAGVGGVVRGKRPDKEANKIGASRGLPDKAQSKDKKRKRNADEETSNQGKKPNAKKQKQVEVDPEKKNNVAKRNRVIARKRQMRKARPKGK